MTQITVILNEDGKFETVLSDSEVNLKVLRRGTDDNDIDVAETVLEAIE